MELQKYRVRVGRSQTETVMKLTAEQAKRMGGTLVGLEPATAKGAVKAARKPRNTAHKPRNAAATPPENKAPEDPPATPPAS